MVKREVMSTIGDFSRERASQEKRRGWQHVMAVKHGIKRREKFAARFPLPSLIVFSLTGRLRLTIISFLPPNVSLASHSLTHPFIVSL